MIGQARSRDDLLAIMQREFNWGGLSTRFSRRLIVEIGVGRWHRQLPMVAVHQARAEAHRRRAAAARPQ